MSGQPTFERLAAHALRLGLARALHPAVLAQQIIDAVVGDARSGDAPNHILVRLSPADAGQFANIASEFVTMLTEALETACRVAGARPFAPWQVEFHPSPAAPPGEPIISVNFRDPAAPRTLSSARDTVRIRRIQGLRLRLADGRIAPLSYTPFLLGRGGQCDLVLADFSVSRRHAEIRFRSDGALEVRDLGSRNGTYHNGTKVASAVLEPGDRLNLGNVTLTLETEA